MLLHLKQGEKKGREWERDIQKDEEENYEKNLRHSEISIPLQVLISFDFSNTSFLYICYIRRHCVKSILSFNLIGIDN